MNRVLAVALGTCAVYGAAIVAGLHMRDLSGLTWPSGALSAVRWHAPARTTIPGGVKGESVPRRDDFQRDEAVRREPHGRDDQLRKLPCRGGLRSLRRRWWGCRRCSRCTTRGRVM